MFGFGKKNKKADYNNSLMMEFSKGTEDLLKGLQAEADEIKALATKRTDDIATLEAMLKKI